MYIEGEEGEKGGVESCRPCGVDLTPLTGPSRGFYQ